MEESQKMTEETQKEKRGKRMEDNKIILYTLAVIESVIWGFSFVGTKAALVKLTPMEVITARWTMAVSYTHLLPYLEQYNEENGTDLVSVAKIHYEPYGIYAGKTATLEELQDGATVAVPNDATNEARALLLLEQEGLITLKEGVGISATALDIVDNPKNLEIVELEAALIPRSLQDVDIAVINGNYAIEAGLNASKDALATEAADSVGADTFANIICVKAGNEENEGVKALVEVLTSDEIKAFINDTYEGAVVPVF